ncbi:hypothetical protein, unknown function [Leishmania mexicana MHOM/GT/2001/U1103]|uniref:Uncharacterized protein n=1 Tax=Leishmania mexicana (strain MHOM/GT/2001/U1103) TaxID=929439 RepID=E9B1Z7_LEIMU|nr:hypothetical protein, unknown function [Leishmania mexicana MHOM/GT/2001/U1103]CBZ29254.1 hypothetical protein, unknown function [Leishmania mexicana MHOM/GT/2001/U1103]
MELYKRTPDGSIAFTLTELEDAAAGVEERRSRESAAAWKRKNRRDAG